MGAFQNREPSHAFAGGASWFDLRGVKKGYLGLGPVYLSACRGPQKGLKSFLGRQVPSCSHRVSPLQAALILAWI